MSKTAIFKASNAFAFTFTFTFTLALILATLFAGAFQQAWAAESGGDGALRAGSAFEEATSTAQLNMSGASARAGGSVNIDVKIAGNPGILGATLELTYDSRLTLTGITNGAAFQALDMTKPGSLQSGCRIHWDATDLADGDVKDGVVATLAFSVSGVAAAGSKCAITVSPAIIDGKADVYGRNLEPVDLRSATCSVTVLPTESRSPQVNQSLSSASVVVSDPCAFTGKPLTPGVTVKVGGKTLEQGSDYSVAYKNNVNAGVATATVTGMGAYTGSKSVTFTIAKAANVASVKSASVRKTLKRSALKKKAKTIALPKVTAQFGSPKWTVSKKDGKKALSLSKGKVKVKKGAKRGAYTIKLKAKVAGTRNYAAASTKVVTVRVKVK